MPVQQGVPLNEATLSAMPKTEREFWKSFLREASETLEKQKCIVGLAIPTDSLRLKYLTALKDYNGQQYCQMQQLSNLFKWFDDPVDQF